MNGKKKLKSSCTTSTCHSLTASFHPKWFCTGLKEGGEFEERFEKQRRGWEKMVFLLVPMFLALIQSRKHDWQDCGRVIANQTKDVLVIPEIQSSLSHLLVKLHKKKKNRKKPKTRTLTQPINKQAVV